METPSEGSSGAAALTAGDIKAEPSPAAPGLLQSPLLSN